MTTPAQDQAIIQHVAAESLVLARELMASPSADAQRARAVAQGLMIAAIGLLEAHAGVGQGVAAARRMADIFIVGDA